MYFYSSWAEAFGVELVVTLLILLSQDTAEVTEAVMEVDTTTQTRGDEWAEVVEAAAVVARDGKWNIASRLRLTPLQRALVYERIYVLSSVSGKKK